MEKVRLKSVPLKSVHIHDGFWDKYIRLVKDVILPYQWDTLNDRVEDAEPSHCIQNFRIAAGEESGTFQGAVFQDTDVTSSEGTVRNGAGDTIKMELMDILKGEYVNPHVSIWWYKLDSIDEVGNPDMWLKANPNIGKTVSYETYQLDVERAEKSPAARNDILAKRFGLPMEGYTYYFTYEETLPHKKRSYWQMPCSLGIDLDRKSVV